MQFFQIVLLVLILLIAYRVGKKYIISKSLKHYTPSETKERTKSNGSILLDVRTKWERNKNSIPGSIHVPVGEIRSKTGELKKYKGKEIICYCQSGSRSLKAAYYLQKAGFNSANMKGGIAAWDFSKRK